MARRTNSQTGSLFAIGLVLSAYLLLSVQRPVVAAPQVAVGSNAQRFELIVVGPDQQPIPEANIEVRGSNEFGPSWIEQGTFAGRGRYGSFVNTDREGRLVVQRVDDAKLTFFIQTQGFGPYLAEWQNEPMPAKLMAELSPAVQVGGIVTDESGEPIAGAQVSPSLSFKNRPGDTSPLGVGTNIVTDDDGRWQYDYMPSDLQSFHVEITHPVFKSSRAALSVAAYNLADQSAAMQRLTMEKGLTVNGTIVDSAGKPIAGALVRTKHLNDMRSAISDADGKYELSGCEPVVTKIVVSAAGKAVDMQEVPVEVDMQSVDFTLQAGGHVRIRVVDENNEPIPKARIFFQRWRTPRYNYFELDHVNAFTDDSGVWEWNEAPLDEFQADICRPGGMQLGKQKLIARAEEYVFSPPPALVVVGRVIDAETKEPIERFQVVPGICGDPQDERSLPLQWVASEISEGRDGQFEYRCVYDYFAHKVKVQARGYLPAESRDIQSNEGRIEITFELQRGADIDMRVMTPDGRPAEGAKVALGLSGSQIQVLNGDMDDGSTLAQREVVNAVGRFRFPAPGALYQLVITHETGYAHIDSEKTERLDLVKLTPWAQAEGTYRVAGKPAPGVSIYLESGSVHSYGKDAPHIFTNCKTVTDTEGHYKFAKVFPGSGRAQRSVLRVSGEGSKEVTSTVSLHADFQPSQTTTLDFGIQGTAVVAKLLPADPSTEGVRWAFADVDVESDVGPGEIPIPDEIKEDRAKIVDWYETWSKTEAGKAWSADSQAADLARRTLPKYSASVAADGSFRIDDMDAGDFVLSVRFWEGPAAGQIRNYKFSVSSEAVKQRATVDLGTIQLE